LGVVFTWIGINILREPNNWLGYVPATLPFDLERAQALQLNGFFDIALGVVLISGKFPKLAALLAAIHLAAILVTSGLDTVLIRDVGLLGLALALYVWPYHRRRRHWWRKKQKTTETAYNPD